MEYKKDNYESITLEKEEIKTILEKYIKEKTNIKVSNWTLWIENQQIVFDRETVKEKNYKDE